MRKLYEIVKKMDRSENNKVLTDKGNSILNNFIRLEKKKRGIDPDAYVENEPWVAEIKYNLLSEVYAGLL